MVPLVTGDRVVVDGDRIRPIPGKSRTGVGFSIRRYGGHTYVIPSDASALVAQGKLDRRLFDVTLLHEEGYDKRTRIPLIVQGRTGLRATDKLPVIGAEILRIPKGDSGFWHSVKGGGALKAGVRKIWLDARLRTNTDRSVPPNRRTRGVAGRIHRQGREGRRP